MRMQTAQALLRSCKICEHRCGVDRLAGERGKCRLTADSFVFRSYVSVTEEAEVIPALRVYFAGCNLRCGFCDTAPECFIPDGGTRADPEKLARQWQAHITGGVRTISILGGEPTLSPHTLLEIAAASQTRLPLAINTNLYMTPEVIELLDGVVTVYLADLKFGNDHCAKQIAGVSPYFEIVARNLGLIDGRTPVIVRHVLLPGHLDCCLYPIINWLEARHAQVRFQLYPGFVPCFRSGSVGLGRLNRTDEVAAAVERLRETTLQWESFGDEKSAQPIELTIAGKKVRSHHARC
jgi:putative pyruvate formate lyase activating enzyme